MEFWQLQKAFCNFSKWKTNEVRRKLNLTDADVKSLLRSIQALISHNNNRLKTLAGEIALINSNSIELQKTLSEVSNDHKHIIEFA